MTKTYCDVCGQEMTEGVFSTDPVKIGSLQDIAGVSDVCKRCNINGSRIAPHEVILEYWRRIVGVSVEEGGTEGEKG